MKLLDLTLDSAYANVALDEALLEFAEQSAAGDDVLRLWEPAGPMVVIGRSSIVADEVNLDHCREHSIPIVRRASGGAAIVSGPGCLMYAVVLSIGRWPALEMLDTAHRMILERNAAALRSIGVEATLRGTSDLAIGDRKISGNSMRRKREWVLYHGTLLYGLEAGLIQNCLNLAPRQPAYRQGRSHQSFVTSIAATGQELKNALSRQWNAKEIQKRWPEDLTAKLVTERYRLDSWNFAR